MSLQIFNAHTGQRFLADGTAFSSLDAFKSWLGEASSVTPSQQIVLTAAGRQAKFPAFTVEPELFLYNRQLVSAPPSGTTRSLTLPRIPHPVIPPLPTPPEANINHDDLEAWQNLFNARQQWAANILAVSASLAGQAQDHFDAISTIERGVGVALGNLQSHVRSLEAKLEETRQWSEQVIREPEVLLDGYEKIAECLNHLPAKATLLKLLPGLQLSLEDVDRDGLPLAVAVDANIVQENASTIRKAGQWIGDRMKAVGLAVGQVSASANELATAIEMPQGETLQESKRDVVQLLEEVKIVATKFQSDFEHLVDTPIGAKALSQASKLAATHIRSHIPSLKEVHGELAQLLSRAIDQRNSVASLALHHMQKIAIIETDFARVKVQVTELDLPQAGADALEKLSMFSQLPLVYGLLLVEAVRRNEWGNKLKMESAILAEDIAGFREEEERRRKKWLKSFGHVVSDEAATGTALKFELNLQAGGQEWLEATRDDITEYLQILQTFPEARAILQELSEVVAELDKPTRRQIKKIKGFKMGSIHESDSGKGSFLLRGDDEVKGLRDMNVRLEEDLKSQKSRVRKLEDLLYKQGQSPRIASPNMFLAEGLRPVSPNSLADQQPSSMASAKGLLSRAVSVNNRRASAQDAVDDKTLARRIVSLEAELHGERQKRTEVESGINTSVSTAARMKAQIEEIQSTNRDLMANMEAQQRELAEERRLLNEEMSRQRVRTEELEDEVDRLVGSRDHERAREEEKVLSLEKQLFQAREEFEAELRKRDEGATESHVKLQRIHARLEPESDNRYTAAELMEAIDDLVERSVLHERELTQALASLRADKTEMQSTLDTRDQELGGLRTQARELEDAAATARNEGAREAARADSLTAELEDGRNQLRILRAKFAEGETGSEALQQRLAEQASKASRLATELAESKSQVINLDVELSSLQRRHTEVEDRLTMSSQRLEQRTSHDRELTNRLVGINDELIGLLETLGLTIVEREGAMSIQRTSKLASASATLGEASTTLGKASAASLSPIGQPVDLSFDPRLARWMHAESEEVERQQFSAFVECMDAFLLGKFGEAVVKLRRDLEWTGKKWKAEARGYRDKYNKAQGDAHDKIAFRSFKEGDLALFLPTRNQATRPWAAFNVGAPHYFLREQESHRLQHREWLVARIAKIDERVVDLSKPLEAGGRNSDGRSVGESESGISFEDDNPFELSDGLRWYLLDAVEEKSGAPSTPGLGKSTVATVQRVDAQGSIRMKKPAAGQDVSTKLNRSLESRRSSSSSKRGSISGGVSGRSLLFAETGAPSVDVTHGTSAAARELQRVTSLTHLNHARPPTSASANIAAGTVAVPFTAPAGDPTPFVINTDEHGTGNRTMSTAPPRSHSPSPRPFLGVFGAASSPRPSWYNRSTNSLARSPSPSSSPLSRPDNVTTSSPSQTLLPTPSGLSFTRTPTRSTATSPSKLKSESFTTQTKTPPPLWHRNSSSNAVSPARKQQGQTWEPLWSLDMSIEEKKDSKNK